MDLVARLLLTYLLHSSVLLGLAGLVRLLLGERRLALQEAVLRAALVGGFLTAGLQVGLEMKPFGGSLALPPSSAEQVNTGRDLRPSPVEPERSAPLAPTSAWRTRVVLAPTVVDRLASAAGGLPRLSWRGALALTWGAFGALALVRLAVAARRLRGLLRDRQPIHDGSLAPEAAAVACALGLRSEVRLSTAPHLRVPLATGVLRPEVCLPTRAVAELGADEQVALCAHELAHVARRDPAWILLARLVEAAAPLQPLNGWARRRLQGLSECLSDDLAVAACARPLGLARSLVDVAGWTLGESPVLPVAAAYALSARSRLGRRVERLMDPYRPLETSRRWALPLAAAAVLATVLVTPVVSGSVAGPVADDAGQTPAQSAASPMAQAPAEAAPPPAQAAPRADAASSGPSPGAEAARADLERQIEGLSHRIAERARQHEGEMKKVEAEMQALVAGFQPDQAEMQRLSAQLAAAAQELAVAATENLGESKSGDAGERSKAAAQRMAELREQLRALTKNIRTDECRALAEKARAIAEQSRPTPEELSELRRLSRDLARQSVPDLRELRSTTRAAMEEARQAMLEARKAMREAAEAARRAGEETAKQHE